MRFERYCSACGRFTKHTNPHFPKCAECKGKSLDLETFRIYEARNSLVDEEMKLPPQPDIRESEK